MSESLDGLEALRDHLEALEVEHLRRVFTDGPIRYLDGGEWTADRPVTVGEVEAATARAGRNHAPGLLRDLEAAGLVESSTCGHLAGRLWEAAEYPARLLPREVWARWFHAAGLPAHLPPVLRLYRGASVVEVEAVRAGRGVFGMSWTVERDRAAWFAGRWSSHGGRSGVVLSAVVPSGAVLCDLRDGGRGEGELVLDTAGRVFGAVEVEAV